jgi:hypothetical protein
VNFASILDLPEGPERTLALVAWFQALYKSQPAPILVGGGAVELYTGGAYRTGDLDFVGSVPPEVAARLEEAGFRRQGRHWLHEDGEVFIELPGSTLGTGERSATLRRGRTQVLLVSPEDLVVDRLSAWQFWGSEQDAVNAFQICQYTAIDEKRAQERAEQSGVSKSYQSLRRFRKLLAGADASAEQLSDWARTRP